MPHTLIGSDIASPHNRQNVDNLKSASLLSSLFALLFGLSALLSSSLWIISSISSRDRIERAKRSREHGERSREHGKRSRGGEEERRGGEEAQA
jgi:hypothetical protein